MRATRTIAVLFVPFLASTAAAVDVTTCGQIVQSGEIGVLQADLDCATAPGFCFYFPADPQTETSVACTTDDECGGGFPNGLGFCNRIGVALDGRAELQLNGHTLGGAGVRCDGRGRCSVSGPGSIVAAQGFGILAKRNVRVTGVAVIDAAYAGIWSLTGNVEAADAIVQNAPSMGIYAPRGSVLVRDSDVTVGNIAVGAARTIKGSGVYAHDSYFGVVAPRILLTGLEATGNVRWGVNGNKIALLDSEVTGNDAGFHGLDIHLFGDRARIRVRNVTCGKSDAGVCADD